MDIWLQMHMIERTSKQQQTGRIIMAAPLRGDIVDRTPARFQHLALPGVTWDEYGSAVLGDQTTDPYEHITWSVGDGDSFYCFDYLILPNGYVALEATINSERGGFIMSGGYEIVPDADAIAVAQGFVDQAWQWVYDNDMAETDDEGDPWMPESEQSGQDFIAAVRDAVTGRDPNEKRVPEPEYSAEAEGYICQGCGSDYERTELVWFEAYQMWCCAECLGPDDLFY
jgi:hypothetical protein